MFEVVLIVEGDHTNTEVGRGEDQVQRSSGRQFRGKLKDSGKIVISDGERQLRGKLRDEVKIRLSGPNGERLRGKIKAGGRVVLHDDEGNYYRGKVR